MLRGNMEIKHIFICIVSLSSHMYAGQGNVFDSLWVVLAMGKGNLEPETIVEPVQNSFNMFNYLKSCSSMISSVLLPRLPEIAGGSAAAFALGGLIYWQVRKNGKGIKHIQAELSLLRQDVAEIKNDIRSVDAHLLSGFAQTETVIHTSCRAIEDRINILEQSLLKALRDSTDETKAKLGLLSEELTAIRSIAESTKSGQDAVHTQLADLEQRTKEYFTAQFESLDSKQDRIIALLTGVKRSESVLGSCSRDVGSKTVIESIT